MSQFHNILVGGGSSTGMGEAIAKASLLAGKGSRITAMIVVYTSMLDEPGLELTDEQKQDIKGRMMRAAERELELAEARVGEGIEFDAEVVWDESVVATILAKGREADAELIINPAADHGMLDNFVQTPSDWALMREATCPVITTKRGPWPIHDPAVLAALDAGDEAHENINRHILATAGRLADAIGGELHVVSTHPDVGQAVSPYHVDLDFEPMRLAMHQTRQTRVDRYLAELDLNAATVDIGGGHPAKAITAYAMKYNIALTVLGTAARKGIAKIFLGNTAEQILPRVHGDVVTVHEPA